MLRKKLIAANWKMNNAPTGFDAKDSSYRTKSDVDVVIFPTFLDIEKCTKAELIVGAQYGRPEEKGAFTGDESMKQIKTSGCTYVLCGHSERRIHHSESDAFVAEQVIAAIDCGLIPILCIGETADEREMGQAKEVVKRQLETVLLATSHQLQARNLVIAYEPVWAIGTGKTATPTDAEEMHAYIRSLLSEELQNDMRIIYGGSMKPENAKDLLSQKNIDGGLVGAASLDPVAFGKIVNSAL